MVIFFDPEVLFVINKDNKLVSIDLFKLVPLFADALSEQKTLLDPTSVLSSDIVRIQKHIDA